MNKIMSAMFLIAAVGVACSAHKPLKSTVDSDSYVAKADLQGKTFHLVRDIEDADSDNAVQAVPGDSEDFGLVKVEITEKELRFLSAFEPNGRVATAKVLASYPVTKHFDIVRDKNDFNEDTNHIIEDTTNPWDQRAYVRVDWADPSNTFSDIQSQLFTADGTQKAPEIKEVNTVLKQDMTNDHGHMSFLTEVGIEGKNMVRSLPPFGVEPLSAYRVTYRTHLFPANDTDYKPNTYRLKDFERFGFFTTQQDFRNPEKGFQDSELKIYANNYNVCEAGGKGSCATNTIKFVLTKDVPNDYKEGARAAISAWNKTFQEALGRKDNVVVLDESVQGTISSPLQNVIALYPERAAGGLLGLSQTVTDPRTGETVSGRTIIYQDGINDELGYVDSIIDLLTSKDPIKNVIGAKIADGESFTKLPVFRADVSLAAEELSRSIVSASPLVTQAAAVTVTGGDTLSGAPSALRGHGAMKALGGTSTRGELRLKSLLQSSPQFFQVPEVDFGDDADSKDASGISGMQKLLLVEDQLKQEQRSRLLQTKKGIHGSEFVDQAVMHELLRRAGSGGTAALLQNREAIKKSIAQQIFFSTLLHELGHSFGLRHNFAASSDQKHYMAKWQSIKDRIRAGDKTVSERDLAPYQYSSVMDYGLEFFSMSAGLGSYDKAAIKYAYNRSIDRDNDQVAKEGYLFCTDHQLDQTINCRQFDSGATATEITQSRIDEYNWLWARRHFRQGQADFNAIGKTAAATELKNEMLSIRQVMDEYMYQKAAATSLSIAGKCTNDFLQGSVDKGELRNICDPTEARLAGVNPTDDSTLIRALYDSSGKLIKNDPSDLTPMGAADLLRANLLAENFFQEVLGTTEPGYFLIQPPKNANSVSTLTALGPTRPSDSDLEADLRSIAKDQKITDTLSVNQFIAQNRGNIIYIPLGRNAKAYSSSRQQVGTFFQLNSVGSAVDKIAAMAALSLTSFSNPRYDQMSISGTPYSFDQSRRFMTHLWDKLILAQGKIFPMVVRGLDGKLVLAQTDAAIDSTISHLAATLAVTKLVTDTDPSMLDKVRVCVKGDAGCDNRLGLQTVEATSSAGTFTYFAVQTLRQDSIAFDLVSSLKKEADERDSLVKQIADPKAAKAANLALLTSTSPDISAALLSLGANDGLNSVVELIKADDPINADELKAQLAAPLKSISDALDKVNSQVDSMGSDGQCRAGDAMCLRGTKSTQRRKLLKLQSDLQRTVKTAWAVADSEIKLKSAPSDARAKSDDLSAQEATVDLLRSLNQALKDK